MAENYLSKGRAMHALLKENVHDLKRIEKSEIVNIVEHLLLNAWDAAQFRKCFHFDVDFLPEEHMINAEQLKRCFEYLKVCSWSTFY